MPGRTERVDASDITDMLDSVVFEGDVIRNWTRQLLRRTKSMQLRGKANPVFRREMRDELKEAATMIRMLKQIYRDLECFNEAATRREKGL